MRQGLAQNHRNFTQAGIVKVKERQAHFLKHKRAGRCLVKIGVKTEKLWGSVLPEGRAYICRPGPRLDRFRSPIWCDMIPFARDRKSVV